MADFTVGLVKPGAVQRGALWLVVKDIERAGMELLEARRMTFNKTLAMNFYGEHAGKPFYDRLVEHAVSGPSYALAIGRGIQNDAVAAWRSIIGPTDPESKAAPPGLRQLIGLRLPDNGVHGSSSEEDALREQFLLEQFFYL